MKRARSIEDYFPPQKRARLDDPVPSARLLRKRAHPHQTLLEDYLPAQKRTPYDGPNLFLEMLPPDMLRAIQDILLSQDRARLRRVCKTLWALDSTFGTPDWLPTEEHPQLTTNPRFLGRTIHALERTGIIARMRAEQKSSPAVALVFRYAIEGGQVVAIELRWRFTHPRVAGLTDAQIARVVAAKLSRILLVETHALRHFWGDTDLPASVPRTGRHECYWDHAFTEYYANGATVDHVHKVHGGITLDDPGTADNLRDLLTWIGSYLMWLPCDYEAWQKFDWWPAPDKGGRALDELVARVRAEGEV